jgi:hypothetical protein
MIAGCAVGANKQARTVYMCVLDSKGLLTLKGSFTTPDVITVCLAFTSPPA